jgi:hypothetical protein
VDGKYADAVLGELGPDRTRFIPAQALGREAIGLEQQVSDLVNAAYGLTPAEVALMWETAPPRMPITRGPGDSLPPRFWLGPSRRFSRLTGRPPCRI